MNRLPVDKRAQILHLLCEGSSLRAAARVAQVSYNTVLKLSVEAGQAAEIFHDQRVQSVPARRVECDELWAFCYTRTRRMEQAVVAPEGSGDIWTWVAIDPDSKLVVSWWLGDRGLDDARGFIRDLRRRLLHEDVLIFTDGLGSYPPAVESAFGMDAQHEVSKPGTTHVKRENLTLRMSMRRFTRATNGHSKKWDNHYYALALYFVFYNFCRPHMSLGRSRFPRWRRV